MDIPPADIDWSLLRAFLAVAEAGGVSRAAQLLRSSQPTLSRQMAALERHLGQPLFERTTRGLKLTMSFCNSTKCLSRPWIEGRFEII